MTQKPNLQQKNAKNSVSDQLGKSFVSLDPCSYHNSLQWSWYYIDVKFEPENNSASII